MLLIDICRQNEVIASFQILAYLKTHNYFRTEQYCLNCFLLFRGMLDVNLDEN